MLSDKAVKEYQEIYTREFGEELPKNEAREQAESFIRLFRLIYRPIPKNAEESDAVKS